MDTTLRGMERETKRFCYSRRPEAVHPFAGCLPQVIVVSALCEEVLGVTCLMTVQNI
jgi:hypothetical protein